MNKKIPYLLAAFIVPIMATAAPATPLNGVAETPEEQETIHAFPREKDKKGKKEKENKDNKRGKDKKGDKSKERESGGEEQPHILSPAEIQARLEATVREKDLELAQLKQLVADQQAELAENDSLLADKEVQLAESLQQLGECANRLDDYEKKIIAYVQYQVFQPYDPYAIESLAVPAFSTMKGRERYDKYHDRYDRVVNYRADLLELHNTLKEITSKGGLMGTEGLIQTDSKKAFERITHLNSYLAYQKTFGASRPKPVYLAFADRALAILNSQPYGERRKKIQDLEKELAQTLGTNQ